MFYEKAFGLQRKFFHESGDYGELETGATTLSFASYELMADVNQVSFTKNSLQSSPPAFEIAFVTDQVEQHFDQAVAAGATILKTPAKKPRGPGRRLRQRPERLYRRNLLTGAVMTLTCVLERVGLRLT